MTILKQVRKDRGKKNNKKEKKRKGKEKKRSEGWHCHSFSNAVRWFVSFTVLKGNVKL